MKLNIGILLLLCFFLFPVNSALATVKGYTYPYDISQIEWQILNWTAAYRDTTTPGDPFILERIEYDRPTRKVMIYLRGSVELASDENLQKSLNGCAGLFKQRFTDITPEGDFYISYKLTSSDGQNNLTYKEYKQGSFSDVQPLPADNSL